MDATFWHGKRPTGVVDRINPDSYPTILAVIEQVFKEHADRPAFTSIGHTLTFADLDRYSRQFASYLQHGTSLQPGDRIAIQLPNLLQYPIAVYGAMRAGLIVVNTNPLYTAREMLYQFNDAGVQALVCLDVFGHLVEAIVAETSVHCLIMTGIGDLLPTPKRQLVNFVARHIKKQVKPYFLPSAVAFLDALKQGTQFDYRAPAPASSDDLAVLQYTGGTTGVAKGAMLTQRNLIANMLQAKAMLSQTDDNGQPWFQAGGEHLIAPLPLYHIYAFTVHLLCMPFMGNHSILIANPRDTGTFIRFIKPWRFTGFIGLNTLFVSLLNHPKFTRCDFSVLKLTLSGGTALQEDVGHRWYQVTGCRVSEAYGLTECAPAVCMNPAGSLSQLGTAGLPLPSTALKIIDRQGNAVPLGQPGELCVNGPQVMPGYWQQSAATAEVLTKDGWLKTGDVAVIQEDGFVKIVDRLKDMILVSGFNVYPNEIEDVVAAHNRVINCAAIGLPDEQTGEKIKLFVQPADDRLTAQAIIAYCQTRLTAYKVPKDIEFRTTLPMTPVGKVLRDQLRQEALASLSVSSHAS